MSPIWTVLPRQRASLARGVLLAALCAVALLVLPMNTRADPPLPGHDKAAHVLTLETAVAIALENNPELAVARKQRGIAESGIVIARTYPFNPVLGTAVMGIGAPGGVEVLNRVFNQNTLTQDVELRGQGKIRRAVATAALSRVEWEIVSKEQQMAVRTLRAFSGYIYQHEKLRRLDERIRLEQETADKVKKLVEQGKLRPADSLLAHCDESEARAQRGPRLSQAVKAWHDLQSLLGPQVEVWEVTGGLSHASPAGDANYWTQLAYTNRAELQVAHLAYAEANERERLEIANRFGNLNIGLKTEYNESRVYFTGGTLQVGLPFYNTRRGEILQRRAEKAKVVADMHWLEIQIQQEVVAALAHVQEAEKTVRLLETDVLPTLRKTRDAFDKLFAQGEPGVDVVRWSELRRRHLRAEDSYVDALWELNQARADLAAAVGDLGLPSSNPPNGALPNDAPLAPPKLGDPEPITSVP